MTFLTLSRRLQNRIDELAQKLAIEVTAKHWMCAAKLSVELTEVQAKLDQLNDLDLE